jgi:hypothetical protein
MFVIVFDFFEENFIVNRINLPTKTISFWSVYRRILNDIPITTNTVEAWHASVNSKTKVTRPSLCKLLIFKIRRKQNHFKDERSEDRK